MLRLLGILTLGNMVFGSRHCHHYHCHHRGRALGRGIVLGTLLGLFMSRASENRTGEEV